MPATYRRRRTAEAAIRDEHQRQPVIAGFQGVEIFASRAHFDYNSKTEVRTMASALAANQSLTFNELKKLLKTTDGNLSVHARKLEEAN